MFAARAPPPSSVVLKVAVAFTPSNAAVCVPQSHGGGWHDPKACIETVFPDPLMVREVRLSFGLVTVSCQVPINPDAASEPCPPMKYTAATIAITTATPMPSSLGSFDLPDR